MNLYAKFHNNADWYTDKDARKNYIIKVITSESWEITEPHFYKDTATVDMILKALDYY